MPVQETMSSDRLPTEHLARTAGAIALAAVAVIHVVDLPGTLQEIPVIGYGYLVLIAAAILGATALISLPGRLVWAAADLIATGAILAYILSRTSGLPTDRVDIGNWNCALGIAAISTETLIVLLASWRIGPQRPHRRVAAEGGLADAELISLTSAQH